MPTVLLIEDDRSIIDLYKIAFARTDYRFETAENGVIGLGKAKQDKPDIILLDMMMPELNGLEVLDELKADPTLSHIPVIALTNMSEYPVSSRAINKGADMFLIKAEIEPHKLVDIVTDMINSSKTGKA